MAEGLKLSGISFCSGEHAGENRAGAPRGPSKFIVYDYADPAGRTSGDAPNDPLVELTFSFGRNVSLRQLSAFAKEKLLHLLFHDFLRVGIEGVQPVFVHDHLGMLQPKLPGIFRNAFVHTLANLAPPRNTIQPRQVPVKLDAVHHARARLYRFAGCRCRTTRFVRHAFPCWSAQSHALGNKAERLVPAILSASGSSR